ncbi:MAG: dipeptide epimerase [Candidatus Buchananbacteria bacterium]
MNRIEIKTRALHFHQTFQIAYESVDETTIVFLKISEGKYFGLGNACPDTEVTKETPAGVERILRKKLNNSFFDRPIDQWYYYHEKIQKVFAGWPSAQAAIEEAILNLFCQKNNISLTNIFGGYRQNAETMITIGIKNDVATIAEIKKRTAEGFKIIKIKCGLNLSDDLKRVKAAAKTINKNQKIVLDANQGYTLPQAEKFIKSIKKFNIALLEQPVAAKNLKGMKKLNDLKIIPIIADESVITTQDALNLLLGNYVSGVNIKLAKCGGPINFIKIFNLAKSLNKIIMLGCMYESNISMTTGAALASALPIDYVDLDSGHLDFFDDPTKGGAQVKNGKIYIPQPLLSINL